MLKRAQCTHSCEYQKKQNPAGLNRLGRAVKKTGGKAGGFGGPSRNCADIEISKESSRKPNMKATTPVMHAS